MAPRPGSAASSGTGRAAPPPWRPSPATVATAAEWGPRRGRSAAEEAVNAARAPRFTPLHAENGDSAATAGFPALTPSWDDPATGGRRPGRPGTTARLRLTPRPGRTRRPSRPGMTRRCSTPAASATATGGEHRADALGARQRHARRRSARPSAVTAPASRPGCPTRPVRSLGKAMPGPARREVVVPPPARTARATGCPSSNRWSRTGSAVAGTAPTGRTLVLPRAAPAPATATTRAAGPPPPRTRAGGPPRRPASRRRAG